MMSESPWPPLRYQTTPLHFPHSALTVGLCCAVACVKVRGQETTVKGAVKKTVAGQCTLGARGRGLQCLDNPRSTATSVRGIYSINGRSYGPGSLSYTAQSTCPKKNLRGPTARSAMTMTSGYSTGRAVQRRLPSGASSAALRTRLSITLTL